MLGRNGLAKPSTDLRNDGGTVAAKALIRGDIDAAFFVGSPEIPVIRRLVERADVSLMSFRRAGAYRRHFPYLSKVTLYEGSIDFEKNLPRRDVALIAATATLVVRDDFHPAIAALLLETARSVQRSGTLFSGPGQFPTPEFVDYPLSEAAKHYFESGTPFIYRYLPFTVAAMIDRLKIMLLPLLTLLLPFVKLVPPLYRWRAIACLQVVRTAPGDRVEHWHRTRL